MRAKKTVKAVYIVCFAILVVAAIFLITSLHPNAVETDGFSPNINQNIAQGGEVRLLYEDSHLYKTGEFSLPRLSKQRVALDDYTHTDVYASIFEHMEEAYVTNQYILYFDFEDDQNTLYLHNRKTGDKVLVAEDTTNYLQIHEQSVYYCKDRGYPHLNSNELWRYNLDTGMNDLVFNDIASFFLQEKIIYTVSCESKFNDITLEEHFNIIRAYDLDTMELLFEKELPLGFVALNIRVNGNRLILWSGIYCWVYLYDLSEETGEYLISAPSALSSQAAIKLNYSNDHIYLSVSVSELMSPSALGPEIFEAGTWRYDPKSKDWLQLSQDVYDALYVFDDNFVFGILGKKVFQIAADGSNIQKLE